MAIVDKNIFLDNNYKALNEWYKMFGFIKEDRVEIESPIFDTEN
jgi:hypothetical protein